MIKLIKKSLILFLILLIPAYGFSANNYIAKDCANNGDGTSWTCASGEGQPGARNAIPADSTCYFGGYTWIRGDTYYIAGSSTPYSEGGCIRNVTGTGTITVKKASPTDHGTDTGWVASYGTSQAIFTDYFGIWKNDVTVDGNYKYGFLMKKAFRNTNSDQENTYNLIIRNVEFTEDTPSDSQPIYFYLKNGVGSSSSPNMLIENCYFHDRGASASIRHVTGQYWHIQDNIFERLMLLNDANHKIVIRFQSNGIPLYSITRRNKFIDACGYTVSGVIELADEGSTGNTHHNIYNNIFYWTPGGCTGKSGGNWMMSGLSVGIYNNIGFYNNTFYNIGDNAANLLTTGDYSGGSNYVYNNLFYNSSGLYYIGGANITKDYQWFYLTPNYTNRQANDVDGTADPFVDSTSYNLHLNASTNAIGVANVLSGIFTTDFDNVTRGAVWDMGAYEYQSGGGGGTTTMTLGTGSTTLITGTGSTTISR